MTTLYEHLHEEHGVWLTRMEAQRVREGKLSLEALHQIHHQDDDKPCHSHSHTAQDGDS